MAFDQGMQCLAQMAQLYQERFDCLIGTDYVLGEYWLDMLRGLRGMLNGETGSLDCGGMDGLLCDLARENGFTDEEF